jgi:exonuclease SbcD
MIRVAHFSDTHLGYRQYNLEEREQDIYRALDEIGDKILEERVDIVVHCGDLFDSPRPTPQAYREFKKFLAKLDGKVKFFAVLGDHDRPKSRGIAPQLIFEDQIHILGVNGCEEHQVVSVNNEEILVAGLSNLSRGYRVMLLEELKKLSNLYVSGKRGILLLHEAVDKFLPYEGAFELHMNEIPKNFGYVAMGHLHARIRASLGDGELAYPGSSEIISKTEISGWQKQGKGFNVVDFKSEGVVVRHVDLECIRPQLEETLNYECLETELALLVKKIKELKELPLVHACVEGKNVDRQVVHQSLAASLDGITLSFRPEVVETSELRLPQLRPGSFNIAQVISEYFKDEVEAGLALELWKYLRYGDTNEAKKVAEEYFPKVTNA